MASIEKTDHHQEVPVLGTEAIQRVITVVAKATTAKRPMVPMSLFERRLDSLQQWFLSHAIHASVAMFATAGLAAYSKSKPLAETTLALAAVSQLLVVAMCAACTVSGALLFFYLRKAPYGPFLTIVQTSVQHDLAYVNELSKCPKEAVQYVLVHYRQERNGYERRVGMLAGAIDKIGIFPALAGLVLLVSNLLKVPGSTAWGSFFGPVLLGFYFLSMAASHMTQKMDRVIALLEFSIQGRP